MAEGPATPRSAEALSAPQIWLTSALLVLFTVAVAAACVVVLSVTLTQTRVSTVVIEGGSIGIRKLDYVGRKWAELVSRIDARSDELLAREAKTDELAAEAGVADAARAARLKDTETLLVGFYFRMVGVDEEFAKLIHKQGHETQVGYISASKDKLVAKNSELAPTIDSIEKAFREFREAERKATAAKANDKVNVDAIAALKEQVKNAKAALEEQFGLIKANLDPETRARVENAFYELNINNFNCGLGNTRCGPLGGPINRGFYQLLTLRPDLLTLLLVILMGVLGSALQMSHAFFMKNQVQTIGGYFQRISVGAMTALVIFIVAKAGVPVLADPSRLGGDAPINPYFISFLAIISGLLSENAITNIQAQGAKLFGGGEQEPKRWARRDLTSDLQAKDMTVAELSGHLGVSETATAAMLKGEEAIEPAQQKILAVCVRGNPRDLYTDIAPAKA